MVTKLCIGLDGTPISAHRYCHNDTIIKFGVKKNYKLKVSLAFSSETFSSSMTFTDWWKKDPNLICEQILLFIKFCSSLLIKKEQKKNDERKIVKLHDNILKIVTTLCDIYKDVKD